MRKIMERIEPVGKRALIPVLLALVVAGCATVSQNEVATADFGPYPDRYQESIKNGMSDKLKDPYSAMYRFGTPRKGFMVDDALGGFKKHFGYIVEVSINGKNEFGAYTGEQIYYFMIAEGKVYDITFKFTEIIPSAKYID